MTVHERFELGQCPRQDSAGFICISDLWTTAGEPKQHRPGNWRRRRSTKALTAALSRRADAAPSSTTVKSVIYTRGRGGRSATYAHPIVALEFAEALNPELAGVVRDAYWLETSREGKFARIFQTIVERARAGSMEDQLSVRGHWIRKGGREFVCVTDLWELAGSPKDLRPSLWKRNPRTKALVAVYSRREALINEACGDEADGTVIYTSGKGRKAATFAHPAIALAYAEVLEPDLGVEMRDAFLKRRASAIAVRQADETMLEVAEQQEIDLMRVEFRNLIKAEIHEFRQSVHQVVTDAPSEAMPILQAASYEGLYAMPLSEVKRRKGLRAGGSLLDHMEPTEGAANLSRMREANRSLAERSQETLAYAKAIIREAGRRTRAEVIEAGAPPPEDMPAADHLRHAKKRIEQHKPLVEDEAAARRVRLEWERRQRTSADEE